MPLGADALDQFREDYQFLRDLKRNSRGRILCPKQNQTRNSRFRPSLRLPSLIRILTPAGDPPPSPIKMSILFSQ